MKGKEGSSTNQPEGLVISREDIVTAAELAGFSLCGTAPYRPMPEQIERLERWLGSGLHGSLGYMERNVHKRADARQLFPDTMSVVVCAVNYRNGAWDAPKDGRPKIASYAFARDYHDSIKSMLGQVLGTLSSRYPGLKGRTLTDTAPLLEKAWAVEAGLGWIGRNSLLITREYGSSVLLGELLLNAKIDRYDRPWTGDGDGCRTCRRCMESCPAGAITDSRSIDASRCISRLTVEPGTENLFNGEKGENDRPLSGWVFGCDECQIHCPHNRSKPLYTNPLFQPVTDPAGLDGDTLGRMDAEIFTRIFTGTPLERQGPDEVYRRMISLTGPGQK